MTDKTADEIRKVFVGLYGEDFIRKLEKNKLALVDIIVIESATMYFDVNKIRQKLGADMEIASFDVFYGKFLSVRYSPTKFSDRIKYLKDGFIKDAIDEYSLYVQRCSLFHSIKSHIDVTATNYYYRLLVNANTAVKDPDVVTSGTIFHTPSNLVS